ncbi:MAG: aspartate aminotransferase, partial [Bacteroidota bacterium]
MNPKLSNRVNNMATSATLAMAAKARELREQGKDIIGLSLGEQDFTVPEFVKDAAIQAVQDDYHA